MKKIITLFLLLGLALSLVACNKEETKTPEELAPEVNGEAEITAQSIYDVSYMPALLEKHESVFIVRSEDGVVTQEDYFSRKYCYAFTNGEAYGLENDEHYFLTDHSRYANYDNKDMKWINITPDGSVDMKAYFDGNFEYNPFSTNMLNDTVTSVTEKDGQIIVKVISDEEEIEAVKAEGWILEEEEFVLNAETLEVISVKGSLHNAEGESHEYTTTFTYDGEVPEGMKKFIEYDEQTEDLRTITFTCNPGTENEKTEVAQAPKGLLAGLVADTSTDKSFTMYSDAECTQVFESPDVNSDVTVYVKWDE